MNVYETHKKIVADYAHYIRSFINIADPEIHREVDRALSEGKLWPEPLLQFNPAYEQVGSVSEFAKSGLLSGEIPDIFKGYSLYRHQLDAIRLGVAGRDFVVTSGTGSGKSLTYIGTIFQHLLKNPSPDGVSAIVVYPMNALINSQTNEFNTYLANYEQATGHKFPITFGQYTGQEKEEVRKRHREHPPQILLTNYMMLELLLTRASERPIRDAIYENLRFLVFDELHTYRGRQGADVAMLIRRIHARCKHTLTCIGTSATMVSTGSAEEQRRQVAGVAETIFGRPFSPDQVVNETLARSLHYDGTIPSRDTLAAAIQAGIDIQADEETLKRHPVAIWVENCAALEELDGRLVRRQPGLFGAIVTALAEVSGAPRDLCLRCLTDLLLWISSVNQRVMSRKSRYTYLPYKLHQFIAQTGSVYTTLDRDENRTITLEPGLYKQDDPEAKPIYPNVFSRATGHAFLCVSLVGDKLEPREFREYSQEEESEATDGYLIFDFSEDDKVWDPDNDPEFLPDSWFRTTRAGRVPNKKQAEFFPRLLHFDEYGRCSARDQKPLQAWFMRAPLLFDPTGGVFFDTKTSENTKLTKLGSEGRSTSTTITAFSILQRLRDAGCPMKDQKILSFTDNRQDAALQAGHFNDFVRVVHLRSGIRKALAAAPKGYLDYATLGEAVFKALDLPFLDFANRSDAPPLASVRRKYEDAFQNFLLYRALADLRRSWRIVLPNLEQCALLSIDYLDLDEVASADEFWRNTPIVSALDPAVRRDFLSDILDFFRQEYAIHSENFLTPSRLKEHQYQLRESLKAPWTLDPKEELYEPSVIRFDPLHRSAHLPSKSLGPSSALGKYLKHFAKMNRLDPEPLLRENYRGFIHHLMDKLVEADYLVAQPARNESNEEVRVYRLRIEKILWKPGDGETVKPDSIKLRTYKGLKPKPNEFFRNLYSGDFAPLKKLHAEDHTGQLNTESRLDREDRFRADWYQDDAKKIPDDKKIRSESISALFCSPTMELGVDIGGLSVVHLRNAPPNAANYAQRSGRAGRSGQGALVFTYCSSFSSHDRHFFQHQAELVAGAVMAPRIDLLNRDLLQSHLHALTVSEIGLPGFEARDGERPSLMHMVRGDDDKLPLASEVSDSLVLGRDTFTFLKSTFRRAISGFEGQLRANASAWYGDEWIDRTLSTLADSLDASLNRWRGLYRSARSLLTRATQPIESGRLTVSSPEYKEAKRQQDQANRQLNLLRNDVGGSNEISEFYPYRYLASEGFLPGYNFTRLPLRIFLPTGPSTGEFISRPRHVALREFGPLNTIYHNGRKYKVDQLVLQDLESSLQKAVVSTKAGYFIQASAGVERCPFSGVSLGDNVNKIPLHDLLEMGESRASEVDRISCEEEERIRKGFDVQTYFTVDAEAFDRIRKAAVLTPESTLLNLRYLPAARLVHVNTRWRTSRSDGFPIGTTTGNWRSSMPEPEEDAAQRETFRLVKLHTSNTADALYIEPIQPLGLGPDGVVTLQYALKRAIESLFQVEPSEIGVVSMGDMESPNILIYEAAEGSLGILSQFMQVETFSRVIKAAERICRFDDPDYLAPASYDDLLSYYNQQDHRRIDRHLIKDALGKLKACTIEVQTSPGFQDYESQYQAMLRHLDPNSSTERKFIQHLYDHGLRLPDAAQKRVDGVYCQPDFYYEPRIWVFCDGTPHDDAKQMIADQEQRQAIRARGDEVFVWHYKEDLAARLAERPDIFRRVR